MLKNDYNYKKIWNSYYIVPTLVWFFFTIILSLALIYELRIDSSLKNSIFIKFLLIVGGIFLLNLFLCIKEITNYNHLIDNGIVIPGKMLSAGTHLRGTKLKASYINERTKQHFTCTTTTTFSTDPIKLQQFIENYPNEVRIMVDPQNYNKAAILVHDYCDKMMFKYEGEKLPIPSFYKHLTEKIEKQGDSNI